MYVIVGKWTSSIGVYSESKWTAVMVVYVGWAVMAGKWTSSSMAVGVAGKVTSSMDVHTECKWAVDVAGEWDVSMDVYMAGKVTSVGKWLSKEEDTLEMII